MSPDLPDTTGYPLEAAREMLSAAGASEIEVARVGRDEEPSGDKRSMVIRQRSAGEDAVDLTVALEWRTPMRAD
jgi:hypothetical protein